MQVQANSTPSSEEFPVVATRQFKAAFNVTSGSILQVTCIIRLCFLFHDLTHGESLLRRRSFRLAQCMKYWKRIAPRRHLRGGYFS